MEKLMKLAVAMLALSLAAAPLSVHAASYPEKPVRMIVAFAAGGPADLMARSVGRVWSQATGQPLVVENRPGANSAVAAQMVFGAHADGYTLLWGSSSMPAIPLLYKDPPFDSFARFTPVSLVGNFTYGLFVTPSLPMRNVAELAEYMRANSDKLTFAASALTEYLAAVQLMKATATRMVRIPYKGSAQAMPDLIAGRVHMYAMPVTVGLPYAKEGRLRVLATLATERLSAMPDVPTMKEAGYPQVTVPSWQGVFGPPKMPGEIVVTLSRELHRAVLHPDTHNQLEPLLVQPMVSSPKQLATLVTATTETWRTFIREYDIPLE
jgi:tripartite-type tricarboxylate transporter receptor subunit TctC